MDAEHANNGLCLPYDLLLDILRRLPGRALAASRCVCRAWRDIVDAHALLFPHVFPREFPGIFTRYYGFDPNFALFGPLLPPDADEPCYRRLLGDYWDCYLKQHCNGLLLVTGHYRFSNRSMNPYVCNPATSRYARLPLPPTPWPCSTEGMFLAFDPAVSRHHEVFFIPTENLLQEEEGDEDDEWSGAKAPCWTEWKDTSLLNLFGEEEPSEPEEGQHAEEGQEKAKEGQEKVFHVLVFSSRTGEWERQEFTPRHNGLGHLYDVVTAPRYKDARTWWSAEYWRGSLYVHCHSGILLILLCSQRTYDMIQLPRQPPESERLYQGALPMRYLASRERGICYAELREFRLEVWDLTLSADDRLGWTLAHEADFKERDRKMNYLRGKSRMQPRMTWAVVESSKDLISLFKHNSDDECNDDYDDGTTEDKYEEVEEEEAEEEEEEDEEDGDNYNHVEDENEEEQDYDDETQGEEEGEQANYHDDEDEELVSNDGSDYSWNSDQHNYIDFDNIAIPHQELWGWGCSIVGFHPYKDVLLLKFSDTVVAYHLHTSRMQYLGYVYPDNHHQQARDIYAAFPYRPCYVDALPSRAAASSY